MCKENNFDVDDSGRSDGDAGDAMMFLRGAFGLPPSLPPLEVAMRLARAKGGREAADPALAADPPADDLTDDAKAWFAAVRIVTVLTSVFKPTLVSESTRVDLEEISRLYIQLREKTTSTEGWSHADNARAQWVHSVIKGINNKE